MQLQDNEATGTADALEHPVTDTAVLGDLQKLWQEVLLLLDARFCLFFLEMQRAAESLVYMLTAGAIVAFLICVSWLGLMIAFCFRLVENGVAQSSAILLMVALNLLLTLILLRVIRHKSQYLKFPATQLSFIASSVQRRAAK